MNVLTLARWMAGEFSNREQAFREPAFFSQIRVVHRPLPYQLFGGISFYVEQAYDYFIEDPYRVRVLHLIPQDQGIYIENYNLKDPTRFIGGARQPSKLQGLCQDELARLAGCSVLLNFYGTHFKGQVEPGKGCKVFRKGQDSYLVSEVEVWDGQMFSLDRGYHPNTDEQLWGSYAGPFQFKKQTSFANEVSLP
jgi:hypothetical protein